MRASGVSSLIVVLLSVASASVVAQDVPRPVAMKEARRLFLAVDEVVQAEPDDRRARLPDLYAKVWPVLAHQTMFCNLMVPPPPPGLERMAPEEKVRVLTESGGWPALIMNAYRSCERLLESRRDEVVALVRKDLRRKTRAPRERGLMTAGRLRIRAVYPDVLRLFQADDDLVERAAYCLRDLGDERAIGPLIARHEGQPTRYAGILRSLQRSRPAHEGLVRLLTSTRTKLRSEAAYALAECRDASLVPDVNRLIKDRDPGVRRSAANIGLLLPDGGYARVRSGLLSLLDDPDVGVRVFVACCLAERKDLGCGPALVTLLGDPALDDIQRGNIRRATTRLAGRSFGFYLGTPDTRKEQNRAAAKAFEKWLRDRKAK